jgi:hypothetical protein
MMDRCANDDLLQANATKMLVITEHFTIISLKCTIIRSSDHH